MNYATRPVASHLTVTFPIYVLRNKSTQIWCLLQFPHRQLNCGHCRKGATDQVSSVKALYLISLVARSTEEGKGASVQALSERRLHGCSRTSKLFRMSYAPGHEGLFRLKKYYRFGVLRDVHASQPAWHTWVKSNFQRYTLLCEGVFRCHSNRQNTPRSQVALSFWRQCEGPLKGTSYWKNSLPQEFDVASAHVAMWTPVLNKIQLQALQTRAQRRLRFL